MPILMEHKEHGLHHVYSDADAIEHEKIGWKRVEKPVKVEPAPIEKKVENKIEKKTKAK